MARRHPIKHEARPSSVEAQIRKAQQDGLFDDLPGKGKPLENLTEVYDPGWWAAKLVQREEVSLLPPALELKLKVERELERIGKLRRERDVRRALDELNTEIARVNSGVTTGPSTSIARLDIETVVERWRQLQT